MYSAKSARQAFNPYLPSFEYVPDGEPYVFGDRVYVYGSHDRFNGTTFCENDYVCWSAPVDSLGDWRYEGVIYRKTQDPMNADGSHALFAPDVARGADGRFYLYYALDFLSVMAVAVCDSPAGQYDFYGFVSKPDGTLLWRDNGDPVLFDPGVLVDDDGRVYLYSGIAPVRALPDLNPDGIKHSHEGCYVTELDSDMKTVCGEQYLVLPKGGKSQGTGFEGHEFFEASSIRKIGETYYLVYSSVNGHELCYATSKSPTNGFTYGGTIVSNGDLYLKGRVEFEDACNYIGNNHGGMVEIKDQWYIFYHRQTNRHEYSRQGMAEPISILPDGSIPQVEMTSCGLNNGHLRGEGEYEARIACCLMSADGAGSYGWGQDLGKYSDHPCFTQAGQDREGEPDQYISNLSTDCVVGFKYFEIKDLSEISIRTRGDAMGIVSVSTLIKGESIAEIEISPSKDYTSFSAPVNVENGKQALYFTFTGTGNFDFRSFELSVNN